VATAVDQDDEALVLSEEMLAALRLEIADELRHELRRERLEALERELALAGVGAPARPGQAEALLDAGYLRLNQAGDAVVARVSEALAAAQRGDEPQRGRRSAEPRRRTTPCSRRSSGRASRCSTSTPAACCAGSPTSPASDPATSPSRPASSTSRSVP
jgi:hypothetical protein